MESTIVPADPVAGTFREPLLPQDDCMHTILAVVCSDGSYHWGTVLGAGYDGPCGQQYTHNVCLECGKKLNF